MPTLEEYLNGVQQRQQKTAILESNLGEAANTNPDEFASMVKLSRAAKISVDAVPEYQDIAKSTELLKKTNVPGLVDTHPQTSKFLADPDKAKLASDDIDNFKETESVFKKVGNFFDATGGVIKSGVLSANAGIVGLVRAPIDALNDVAGVILPVRPFTPLTDALAEYQKGISKSAQAALPQAEGDIEKGIVSGGVSLVRNTLNLPLLFAGPNGQRAYFSATLAPVFGEEYGQAKDKGLSTVQAITYGGSQTAIEYATEKIPVSKLIGDLKAGSPFYKTLYNQLLTEIPGEQAATLLQDLNQWAVINPEKPFKTYIEERPSAALQTLVATTVGVGGSTVISTGLEKATNAYADKADAAQRAEGIAGVIENMNKLSAANKVRTRDAETFEEWINQVSEDSPIQNVYINAETLKQSGLDKQLLEVAPDLAGQIETAAAMGRDIQIPISEYMTKIAPTPLGDAMLDNLRAEGETMTRKEAREFVEQKSEELQAAAEQLMVQKENDQKFLDSAKEVETNMFDQLKSTGVYTTAASKNFATYVRDIYVTKAAAMGITPSELYNMIPYKITSNMPGPEVQLFSQDGKVQTETEAFKAFYGNSVFKTEQGAPVTLYHGTADDVTQFDVDHPNRKDSGWLGTGVYLTDSTDMAELYAMQKKRTGAAGENVMPLYARLENPYYATAEDKSRVRAGGREAADQFTADLQAQGYDGVIYQVAPDAKEIVVFDPAAVKSQFNDGTWSDDNNLLSQKSKAQAAGKQVPTTLDELANVDAAFKFAASQTFATNRDFKVALQDRVLSAAKAAKVDLGDFTEAVEQYLVRVALADAVTALETNPNAVGWYNEKVTKALRLVSLIHPEINTDPQAKFAFTWALAVTSNGLKVDKNFELAERAYAAYKETGKMPTNMQAGQAQIAINESLGMFNDLIEKYGFETVEKFMTTKQTVKQVVEFTGKNVSGENLTTEVYGAAALGPKIGNGFFANLYGHFEQLTMDRWLMRTWGRWTGTLLDDNKANIKIKQTQLKSTIQAMSAADKKAFEAIIKTKLSTTKLNEVAEAIEKASMKPENRRQMAMIGALDDASRGKLDEIFGAAKKGQLRVSMGDELRKVGNSLSKYMDGQKEAPSGPPERARIRKVMSQALTNLQQQFPSLTMSDLQALLWYPEKRLYDSAKTAEEGATGYEDNEAPDYANAAAALAKEKGVSEETINQTIKDVDNELSAIAAERAAGAKRDIRDSVLRQGTGPTAPAVDERTGLDLNPDGTVTLYHHTSSESAGAIKRSGQLVSAGEPSVYVTTRRETDTGYGDTVVTVRVNPDRLNIDDEFPNGRQDFRIDVGQPGGAVQVQIGDYKSILNQPDRGGFDPKSLTTILTKESDYSTFIHETTHFYLDMLTRLAEMPNAPQSFKDDLTAVLEWSGATPQEWATWNQEFRDTGKMNDGMRKVHEAFAYNSEIYIATGNAPSLKMQTMFDQFAAWLRRVYESIRDELNVIYRQEHGEDLPILTGEVRQVMDRMLASDEQITQAETVRGMAPIYQSQEQSGMDDATWAAYLAMSKEAQDQSVSDLTAASLRQMRWLSNAKSRIFKEMQKQNTEIRKDVRAQVAKEIEQQPIYRALRLIKFGEQILEDGTTVKVEQNTKLSVSGMQELYMGEGDKYALLDWSSLGYGKYGMLSEDGVHPDVLAERTGFSSGDELVRSLLNAKTLKEAVEEKTDQRMLEEYGDLSDQRSMDLAVERALHNEARARFVAAELRHASKATQPVRVMLAAARQAARRIIGNKLVRDTKVSEYSAAETRATRAAEKAMKEGKPEEVTKQLQNRLLNNQLTAEATKATQEVDKGIRYLKSVQTDQSRKRVGADYSDQIDQLLSRFDLNNRTLKSIDAQTSLLEWMKSQEDAGYQPEISLTMQNEGYRKNYKNMTVDEFRDLVDAVKQIEHMGRTEQNMLTAAKETAYREARDQIVESINANANGRTAEARTPTTEMGRRLQGMKRFFAAHLKAANVALILDGGKEGAMWEYFIRTANKRGDQETEMRAKATEHLTEIFAPIFKLGKMGGAGLSFPTIGRSLNREARIAIGLNMGNEGNIQRLLDGEGWTREQIQPVLDSLTAQEWLAIQKVWDYFESYRPAIAEKERRIYGKEPKWIDPKALTVNVGNGETLELRGGYYPVKYDPQATIQAESGDEKEAAKRQLQGAFTSTTTRRSFTKSRVEKVEGRPLIYTLAGMYSGINDVIHDLAWHEWLIDANKLLRSQSIDQAIRTQYGPEFKQQLKTWVQDVAAGEQAVQNEGEIALNYLRQSISAAGLGFNVMSALQQITGFNQSIVKVGARYIGRGIAQTITDPRAAMKEVNEKSSFMANRARTQFRELNELRNMVQDETAAMRQVRLGAYFMMSKMQRMVDVPTWLGAYEKAIGEGNDESRSIALADQAVIDSQGGGMLKDLSRVERGGAGLKLFTVYYSYMNTVMNLATVKTMTAKSKGKLAADYAMLFVVPVVLTTALKQALTPGGDDEWDMEKLARKLAAEQLSYLMGTMIILREFGQAGQIMFGNDKARDYSGPAGLRVVADAVAFLKQASQLEFDDSFRKAAINLLGDVTGLPSAQINRTITGTTALVEGKTDNPAAIVLGKEK
jgi:hypothetical protein